MQITLLSQKFENQTDWLTELAFIAPLWQMKAANFPYSDELGHNLYV